MQKKKSNKSKNPQSCHKDCNFPYKFFVMRKVLSVPTTQYDATFYQKFILNSLSAVWYLYTEN